MKKKVSRLLALCLAVLMTAAMLPLTAMAEDDQQQITVTFKVGDEVYGEPVVLPAGTALGEAMPADPDAPEGKEFLNWKKAKPQEETQDEPKEPEYITKDTIFTVDTEVHAVFVDQTAPISSETDTNKTVGESNGNQTTSESATPPQEPDQTQGQNPPQGQTEGPDKPNEPENSGEPKSPSNEPPTEEKPEEKEPPTEEKPEEKEPPVEQPTALDQVKALIEKLPKEVTADNCEKVKEILIDIDKLRETDETVDAELSEEDIKAYRAAAQGVDALENGGNSSEPETIPDVNYIAYIGNTGYSTIQDAVEAASANDTINVVANTTESVTISKGKTITLDFAKGVVLTLGVNETITNKGTLTITGEGTITKVEEPNTETSTIINEGTLTIKGGTFENQGKGYVISNGSDTDADAESSVTIEDGKFTAPGNGYIFVHKSLNKKPVSTTVNGGQFSGELIETNQKEGLKINDGTFDAEVPEDLRGDKVHYVLYTDGVDGEEIFKDEGPTACFPSTNVPPFSITNRIERLGYKDFDSTKSDAWNVETKEMNGRNVDVYTPKWELATYQITYSTQGNLPAGTPVTGAPPDATAQYNTQITLPNLPKSAGYVCVGWTADSDGKTYQTGDAFTMPAKNVTFTAKWGEDRNGDGIDDATQPHYQVTYTDGVKNRVIFEDLKWTVIGDNQPTPPYQDENGAYGDPVREGYLFTGWTPEVADTVTASVTYTATWKADKNQNGIPDENETEYRTVRVVWTDRNNAGKTRPSSVTVQLMKNGTAYGDPVKLSASNKWTYKWTTLENDQNYEVVEMVVPKGYNVKYSKTKYTFTITNKRSTTQYTTSGKPLQTGQLNWPIPVLAVCGLAFIGGGLALILRKKRGSYGK